jgi:hypothetical protein
MPRTESIECPFCLDRMDVEEREGVAWMVCPNGCATEFEAPAKDPAPAEIVVRARAVGQ